MPVVVRSSFLLVAALIGFVGGFGDVARTITWITIVFFSILIHEFGHAFAARRYSAEVAIEVNGLGGLTRWTVDQSLLTPGRRAFIAAAGSAVGILFGGLVWAVASVFAPFEPFVAFTLNSIIYINLFWGLLNWLPIRPLDGGHLLESLLQKIAPERGEGIATAIFTLTAAVALAVAIWQRFIFIAVLAGWMLLSEFSRATARNQPQGPPPPSGLPTLSYDDESASARGDAPLPDPGGAGPEDTTESPH